MIFRSYFFLNLKNFIIYILLHEPTLFQLEEWGVGHSHHPNLASTGLIHIIGCQNYN